MKRLMFALVIVLVLALYGATAVSAQPADGCPEGFHLHPVGDHDHDHHIGLKVDLNENGFLCVLELSDERHVHIDDVIP